MASFKQDDKSKLWSVRFRVIEDNKEVNKRLSGFGTKKEATSAFNEFMLNSANLKETPPARLKHITFTELFENYKKYYIDEIKGSAYITFIDIARLYILPYFGNKEVNSLTTLDIVNWKTTINSLTKRNNQLLSLKYKNNMFTTLTHIINYGIKFYELKENVASRVGGFKDKNAIEKDMLFWTPSEFKQFISVADNLKYKTVFLFLYLTGCRKGEMSALQWKDFDSNNKTVRIYKTITRKTLDGTPYKITPPKSKNSTRIIHLPSMLHTALISYHSTIECVANDDYIFGNSEPLAFSNVDRYMIKWIELSKVKKIRVHDLRHSHVSFLIHASTRPSLSLVYIIANRIGDRPEEVMQTYGHMFPNDQEEIINEIENVLEKQLGTI